VSKTRLVNARPSRRATLALGAVPFVVAAIAYASASASRLAENARDNLLPSAFAMYEGVKRIGGAIDPHSGLSVFAADTFSSLERLVIGLGLAALIGLAVGIALGLFPFIRAMFSPFVAVVSIIPPFALLPIILITMGLGEASKIFLIVLGIAPFIARDIATRTQEIPVEVLIKAQTLGASTHLIVSTIVLPQMLPRLLESVRVGLGSAWLFLLAGEAIAAQSGLGYRIFLVRRYMAMDVIIPYVLWITLIAFTLDYVLKRGAEYMGPWIYASRATP
jgi:NitT/TauT family transport system permease protein